MEDQDGHPKVLSPLQTPCELARLNIAMFTLPLVLTRNQTLTWQVYFLRRIDKHFSVFTASVWLHLRILSFHRRVYRLSLAGVAIVSPET